MATCANVGFRVLRALFARHDLPQAHHYPAYNIQTNSVTNSSRIFNGRHKTVVRLEYRIGCCDDNSMRFSPLVTHITTFHSTCKVFLARRSMRTFHSILVARHD